MLDLAVIQEVALAREAYFIRGDYILPWQPMGLACHSLAHLGYWADTNLGVRLPGLDNAVRIDVWTNESVTLSDLLTKCYRFKSSDPRDKVFGVLGLLQSQADETSRSDVINRIPMLKPDYHAPDERIYNTAVETVIEKKAVCGYFLFLRATYLLAKTTGTLMIGRLGSQDSNWMR